MGLSDYGYEPDCCAGGATAKLLASSSSGSLPVALRRLAGGVCPDISVCSAEEDIVSNYASPAAEALPTRAHSLMCSVGISKTSAGLDSELLEASLVARSVGVGLSRKVG